MENEHRIPIFEFAHTIDFFKVLAIIQFKGPKAELEIIKIM